MRPTGHRRHHTWPQCGSELCMRGPHGLEVHVFNLFGGPTTYTYIPLSLQQAMVAPLRTEELLCGDMGMPELSHQPKRIPRFWFQSSTGRSNQSSRSGSSGQTKQAYRSVLRRLARRPPLSKTRSLFVVPSNTTSNDSYLMSEFIPHRNLNEQAVFRDYLLNTDRGRSSVSAAEPMAERRHRRCHSEQPRAWRKPSATLWTLQEYEE